MQQVFEIPADVNYEPQAVELPDYFLRPAPPPIDENDWPVWRAAQEFLPKPRQIRALRCRRHALHIVKETITGNVESVNPIACGDRAACPRCATAYAHERWWDHWSKLGVVALSQHVRLHILEFRCAIPEWNAAVKVAGCELSETIGRLCAATTTCGTCSKARNSHEAAAQVENEISTWITKMWQHESPYSGGVRHTRLEQPDLLGPIELVITLHVPAVAVRTWPGRSNTTKIVPLGERRFFQLPDLEKLRSSWSAFIQNIYGGTASFAHTDPEDALEIREAMEWTHRSSFESLTRQLMKPGVVVLPDTVRTFARACGLGTTATSGKTRKVQRSTWFGPFTGASQQQTLNTLKITLRITDAQAKTRVIDSYRILHVAPEAVTVQSRRTAEIKLLPRSLVKLATCVDSLGRPTEKSGSTAWVYDWRRERELLCEQKAKLQKILNPQGLNADTAWIANNVKQSMRSARQKDNE